MKTIFIFFALLPFFSFGECGDHSKGILKGEVNRDRVAVNSLPKKVLMHYMLWYGDSLSTGNDSLRHWNYGYCYTPLIGRYNSKSWSLLNYHVLLSYSCGIDGIVANVLDAYDSLCFMKLLNAIRNIRNLDPIHFNYSFAISYDDQRYGANDTIKLQHDLIFLRDSVFPFYNNYLTVNDTQAVFVFDYPGHLSARQYKAALKYIIPGKTPKLCWNESEDEVMGSVDICYPWVQPYDQKWDTVNGREWGKRYVEDFFWRINNIPGQYNSSLLLGCSGVWPGFNDSCNTE